MIGGRVRSAAAASQVRRWPCMHECITSPRWTVNLHSGDSDRFRLSALAVFSSSRLASRSRSRCACSRSDEEEPPLELLVGGTTSGSDACVHNAARVRRKGNVRISSTSSRTRAMIDEGRQGIITNLSASFPAAARAVITLRWQIHADDTLE